MSVTPIDLSALDDLPEFGVGGKPLLLDIDLVHEDPDQPRKAFDDILELAASVGEVGVKVPISVRPHPVIAGHYMVKFGARRRRAAIATGLKRIPAWIDDVPSDFEQVIENLQRSDLTPMELATFMSEKISTGMKHGEIAKKLGIHRTQVTKHMALIDAPPDVEAVYRSGRSTSPETLFELRAIYAQFPEETKAWLAQDVDVSRRSVEALKLRLIGESGSSTASQTSKDAKTPKAAATLDPLQIRRPVVAVRVRDRFGVAVLSRCAADHDHVLIKWDDTGEIEDVAIRDVVLVRIDDARRYEPAIQGLSPDTDTTPLLPAEQDTHI